MIPVVAAMIVREGKVLLARRPEGRHLAGYWEFPGGKIEKGESPEQALERELREELDVQVRVGRIYRAICHGDSEKDVLLLFYAAEIVSGCPRPIEEAEVRCFSFDEVNALRLAPADARLLKDVNWDDVQTLL